MKFPGSIGRIGRTPVRVCSAFIPRIGGAPRAVALAFAAWLMGMAATSAAPAPVVSALLREHCFTCHDRESHQGNLDLESLAQETIAARSDAWEQVARRLQARQMPPAKRKSRPTESEYQATVSALVAELDAAAVAHPRPGRTETLRRLNRTEYQNSIRDLLDLEIDAAAWLPADPASHGFDNVTVGTLPPTLLDRYITAAGKISRLALGTPGRAPGGDTIRIRPDITQEEWVEGLPFGTRGGALIPHTFPQDGTYEIQVRLTRDRNDEVEGLREPHDLVVLLDGAPVQTFVVRPPAAGEGHHYVDAHLKCRLVVTAGPHRLGVTFLKNPSSLLETKRQPYQARFNFHRHPRSNPALYQVSITGPFDPTGPGDSPSRRRLLVCRPAAVEQEEDCARRILGPLLHRAWRRPVSEADIQRLLPFFEAGRQEGGFEAGIESALGAVLVSREFLFRVEQEPEGLAPGAPYPVSGLALASRLSFFLWSSLPDDELLAVAERGELGRPEALERETRRMLADPRAQSLTRNFAGQWLHLRNLDSITPDGRLFPDFDDNLRQAMRRETELQFARIVREDRSVLELLQSGETFLNERLARHYGIPHVHGAHFRRVALGSESGRGGLLRQAGILTLTSYANRTSPVLRGKWVLENLIGTPPPPPLPDVPSLDESPVSESLPVRARLAAHRDKQACASCHEFIDPPGFALEHFDAVGRWRDRESDQPVDDSGGLPDGSVFAGVAGLEQGLLRRPELFVGTLTEKLLTFALGRGVESFDAPAVRAVLRRAASREYRFSEIVVGVALSAPFRMRQNP